MRIAIDARAYFQRTGIARYTRGLVRALDAHPGPHEYRLLLSTLHAPAELALGPRMSAQTSEAGWLAEDEAEVVDAEARAWGADVIHAVFPPMATETVPTVATVFDVTPLTVPHLHQATVVDAFTRGWARVCRQRTPLVATSEATRTAATRHGASPAQVSVTGIGLSAPFDAAPPVARDDARSGVLFVGTLEPRKNLPLLLGACERLARAGRPTTLTVVGKAGWGDADVTALTATMPWVRVAGYVSDDALLSLYRSSAVLACPSTEEGFGLPVLEAMAQGALPLVSRDPALAELVGDASLALPDDIGVWADALARWLDDPRARAHRSEALRARARSHTWSRIAAAWVDTYARSAS